MEEEILKAVDHPFLPRLYATFQTEKHLHFVVDYCTGGELYELLQKQPNKRFKEDAVKFYAAEVRSTSTEGPHYTGVTTVTCRH